MKNNVVKIPVLLIVALTIGRLCLAQNAGRPKELKAKGTYVHVPTLTEFPERINDCVRQRVYSFDKQKNNIGVAYKCGPNQEKTTISLFLYPAGMGCEGRLRNEYLHALSDIADISSTTIGALQYFKNYKKGGYTINGYSARITGDPKSQVSVFECGKWFFKIRITTSFLDSTGISTLEKEVLDIFEPTRIAKNSPLNVLGKVYVAPAAFSDSLMLGSALSGALDESIWARENVDSLERISGFPDLYLGLHIKSLSSIAEFQKTQNYSIVQQSTRDYLGQLNEIIGAGFLEEFIMEQFNSIMIVPENITLDFESFDKWKADHPIGIDLKSKLYLICYEDRN